MFSAYDLQCDCYFHTGRNSDTEKQCEIDIVEHLLEGEYTNIEIDEIIENDDKRKEKISIYEVRIDEHKEKIDEE